MKGKRAKQIWILVPRSVKIEAITESRCADTCPYLEKDQEKAFCVLAKKARLRKSFGRWARTRVCIDGEKFRQKL